MLTNYSTDVILIVVKKGMLLLMKLDFVRFDKKLWCIWGSPNGIEYNYLGYMKFDNTSKLWYFMKDDLESNRQDLQHTLKESFKSIKLILK